MKYIGEVFYDRRRDYLDLRNAFFASEALGCDIVMIGDSITESFNLAFAGATNKIIVNSGVSGDRLKNIHHRIYKDAINLRPKAIMLMAGINDLLTDEASTTENYKSNIKKLFEFYERLTSRILKSGISPICCGIIKINQFEHNHMFKNQQIEYFNYLVEEFSYQKELIFIDYNEVLKDEYAGIDTTYFLDGLHPNEKGYFEMFKYLKSKEIL